MTSTGHRLSAIAEAVGGRLLQGDGHTLVTHLAIDSRKAMPREGVLFIALQGERHDGHRYIPDLVDAGVRSFLIRSGAPTEGLEGCHVIAVPDTLDALQRLAAWHRGHIHAPVIGITGSNGKTIVKEWLAQLLQQEEHIARSPGSWNSQVGVPLSVWAMNARHTLGLFEAGISRPGEMERLRPIIHPTIGLITNIGPAHAENFRDDREKALEKLKLFRDAQALVYCRDHVTVHKAIFGSGLDKDLILRDWSREEFAYVQVTREERGPTGCRITALHDHLEFTFELPFTDNASIENALHCVTLLLHLGRTPEHIAERMRTLAPVAMRLEMVEGVEGSLLINDAYSNDEASLRIALDHLMANGRDRRRVVVLSDIEQSGEPPEALYQRIAHAIAHAQVDRVLTVGPHLAAHAKLLHGNVRTYPDTEALLQGVDTEELAGAAVLVKGARRFALERAVERWQAQVHGTVLEVDLEAVRHNLNYYRALLRPGTRVMPMVKAFGYGSGAVELARLFAYERVDMLGVAYADEGIALRQAGITVPILVMNPEPVPFDLLHRFDLEAEVYDERSLLQAIAFHQQRADGPPVHLKIDTGMHRLGFLIDELPRLIDLLGAAPFLRVGSIFSHLAASEDPAHDAFTREQIARFIQAADRIDTVLGYRPLRHIANSGGISRFPEAHFDMVRPGIGLHGVGVDAAETRLLRPAATLRTVIAQLKQIPAGESVSYGLHGKSTHQRRVAVLPVGYADGLFRTAGHGKGKAFVHDAPAPYVGTICMDMCMVDVTDISCSEGDPVVLFGGPHPVSDYAHDLDTIPYEALTAVGQRVKRVFVHGD